MCFSCFPHLDSDNLESDLKQYFMNYDKARHKALQEVEAESQHVLEVWNDIQVKLKLICLLWFICYDYF